jgi:hypothetical protein
MDKKIIKAAIEALIFLRYAESNNEESNGDLTPTDSSLNSDNQGLPPKIITNTPDGGGDSYLLNPNLSVSETANAYLLLQNQNFDNVWIFSLKHHV